MKKITLTVLLAFFVLGTLPAQINLKVMHYNLLQFGLPCSNVTTQQKYTWLGTILNHYQPDIFTVNELNDQTAYANGIKALSFSYTNDVANADFTNQATSNIVNQLFYNTRALGYAGGEVIPNSLRDINVYKLFLKPEITQMGQDTTFLYCIVAHLKAGNSTNDANSRQAAANSIMSWVENAGLDENILLLGDMNTYSASEAAFQSFVFNANTNIRFQDPSGKQGGWGGGSNALHHTQSTRSNSPDCGSGGGMDDRFDMILANAAIMDGTYGIKYVNGSYTALGNDGTNYNQELICDGSPVPVGICSALKLMSDHLPVVMELKFDRAVSIPDQLPSAMARLTYQRDGQAVLEIRDATQLAQGLDMQLLDFAGRTVWQSSVGGNEILLTELAHFSPGFYMLVLRNQQGAFWREKVWLR